MAVRCYAVLKKDPPKRYLELRILKERKGQILNCAGSFTQAHTWKIYWWVGVQATRKKYHTLVIELQT